MSREAAWTPDSPDAYCPRCASTVGAYEADVTGCAACRGKRLAWERCVRLGPYEGVLRDAILSGKYTGWRRMCQDLGADLRVALRTAMAASGVGWLLATMPRPR